MFTPLKAAVFAVVAISAVLLGSMATGHSAHAEMVSAPTQGFITLEVTPICADNTAHLAYWKVVNKNADPEIISWTNYDNATSGTYTAPAGESKMSTGYDLAAGNNRTGFVWTNNVSSTNSSNTPCNDDSTTPTDPTTPPVVTCIDGSIQQNLVITKISNSQVSIKTKDGAPLCDDVTVFFSSYVMPYNYDGNGFYGNPTAYPQTKFDSDSVTLTKGTDGTAILTITLPASCENVQTDVYYGPEITSVGADGHGTQNIVSNVILSDGTCDSGQGGAGGGDTPPTVPTTPTTPVEPMTPVVTPPITIPTMGNGAASGTSAQATSLPAELPHTGANGLVSKSALIALLAGLATYGILFAVLPRRAKFTDEN